MRGGLRGGKCRGWGGVGPQKAQYKNSRQIAHKASKRQSSPCPKTYSAVFGKRQQKCCIPRWMAVHSKGGALLEGRMGDMGGGKWAHGCGCYNDDNFQAPHATS